MTLTSAIPAEWTMSIGCEWSHWQEHSLETILAGGFVNRAGNGHPYTTILELAQGPKTLRPISIK